ncbi:MAG: hypothetical protein U0Q15_09150 [Kineosporiaceae bacterium]
MGTLILTPEQCEALLRPAEVVACLERAHRELATGGATQPAPVPIRAAGDLGPHARPDAPAWIPMGAHAAYLGVVAVKLLADAPANRALGVPAQRSTAALFDAATAECLALVDGRVLTRVRTAAATALATRTLAVPGPRVLGLLGAGALAVEHVRAHAATGDLDGVVVWSRTASSRERLRAAVEALDVAVPPVKAVDDVAEVFATCDVVCTLTPAEVPLVSADLLRPGLHVNAVGSPPRPAYRELEPSVLARADVLAVDDVAVAAHESGNVVTALAAGAIGVEDLVPLGAVLAGTSPGRTSPEQVSVFNSVGIGLQDLAAMHLLHARALERGVGEVVTLR